MVSYDPTPGNLVWGYVQLAYEAANSLDIPDARMWQSKAIDALNRREKGFEEQIWQLELEIQAAEEIAIARAGGLASNLRA